MKFGKEFASQMIPEWHEMYMDYNHLKKLLKQINTFKEKNRQTIGSQHSSGQKMELALYRAFSGLTLRQQRPQPDIENPVISVDPVNRDGSYETRFLKVEEEGAEYELVYFRRLDDEFNKVFKFYTSKVEEVMEEATKLEKQMHALIGFRIKVEKPYEWLDASSVGTRFASDNEVSVSALSAPSPSWEASSRQGGRISIDAQESGTISRQEASDESSDDTDAEEIKPMKKIKFNDADQLNKPIKNDVQENTIPPSSPLEILDRVKINISRETPKATIKALLNVPKQTELKFNKENFKQAEELLKRAFIEYYHKLRLLKSFSFINMLAFSKIMKKYDKITSRTASKSYMKMVESSFQPNLNEVNMLVERVEVTFIKHFSNSNRSKGMQILRPKPNRERHRISFSLGLFVGCSAALIVALILIIRARDILQHEAEGSQYMNTMFPLYSLFGFVVLHMMMYSGNIYFWRRYRVNYSFIFGLKPGTEIGYRDVLYLSFALAVLAQISVLSNLDLEMDPKTNDYEAFTELVPLILVGVIVGVLICPFNTLYRSSRYFFLKCVFRCICAPLYTVTLADCIMADQLTSQIQAFRSLEFYICYYGWGDYRHRADTCKSNHGYNTFSFIIAAIPFGIRLFQNVRLMYQTNNTMWGYNAVKYFATIVAVCTRTAYSLDDSTSWEVVAWITSAFAAVFCTYWDLVIDWGLLNRNSKNRWLRDKMVIPHKSIYFGAMVLNVLLRFAWLQTVLNFKISSLHTQALVTIVASLEIIRRGIWNFFRLENEHLTNVSKFRAFKSVPLPFNYDEDEEKDN